jgi:hypothetical protein
MKLSRLLIAVIVILIGLIVVLSVEQYRACKELRRTDCAGRDVFVSGSPTERR